MKLKEFIDFGAEKLSSLDFDISFRAIEVELQDFLSGSLILHDQENLVVTCSEEGMTIKKILS